MEMELDSGPAEGVEVLQMPDVLSEVLAQLCAEGGPVELCRVARVSKAWKEASQDPKFWQHLKFKERAIEAEQLLALVLRHSSYICSLHLARPAVFHMEDVLHRALPALGSLRDLTVNAGCYKAHNVLEAVMAHRTALTQLRTLTLKGMYVDSGIAVAGHAQHQATGIPSLEFTLSLAQLEELQLGSSSYRRLAIQGCPALERLTMQKCHVVNLVMDLPNLRVLSMHELSLQPRNAAAALSMLPSLTELSLQSALTCNDEFMAVVCAHLNSLQKLDISHCKSVTLATMTGLNALRVLNLRGCDGIRDQQLQAAMQACWSLEEVYLDGAAGLMDVSLSGPPALRVLSLRSCAGLLTICIKCHQLRELALGKIKPGSATSNALHLIQLSSFSMQKISWADLPCLEKVQLDCPNLTHISLVDCDRLSGSAITAWSNSSPLPVAPDLPASAQQAGGFGGPSSKPTASHLGGIGENTWEWFKQPPLDVPDAVEDVGDTSDTSSDGSDSDGDRPAGALQLTHAGRHRSAATRSSAASGARRRMQGQDRAGCPAQGAAAGTQQQAVSVTVTRAVEEASVSQSLAALESSLRRGAGSGSAANAASGAAASVPFAHIVAPPSSLSAGTAMPPAAPPSNNAPAGAQPADGHRLQGAAGPAGDALRSRMLLTNRARRGAFLAPRPPPAPAQAPAAPAGNTTAGNAGQGPTGSASGTVGHGYGTATMKASSTDSEGSEDPQQRPGSLRQLARSMRPRRPPAQRNSSGGGHTASTVLHGVRDASGGIWPSDNMQPVTADGIRFDMHMQRDQFGMGSPSSSGAAQQRHPAGAGHLQGRPSSSTAPRAAGSTQAGVAQPTSTAAHGAGSSSVVAPGAARGAAGRNGASGSAGPSTGSGLAPVQGPPGAAGLSILPWKRGSALSQRDNGSAALFGGSGPLDRDRKRRARMAARDHNGRGTASGNAPRPSVPKPSRSTRQQLPPEPVFSDSEDEWLWAHKWGARNDGNARPLNDAARAAQGASSSMAQGAQGANALSQPGQAPQGSVPPPQAPSHQLSDTVSPGTLAADTLLSLAVNDLHDVDAMCMSPVDDNIWGEPLMAFPDSPEMAPAGPSSANWLSQMPLSTLLPPSLGPAQPNSSQQQPQQQQQPGASETNPHDMSRNAASSSPARQSSVFRSLADRLGFRRSTPLPPPRPPAPTMFQQQQQQQQQASATAQGQSRPCTRAYTAAAAHATSTAAGTATAAIVPAAGSASTQLPGSLPATNSTTMQAPLASHPLGNGASGPNTAAPRPAARSAAAERAALHSRLSTRDSSASPDARHGRRDRRTRFVDVLHALRAPPSRLAHPESNNATGFGSGAVGGGNSNGQQAAAGSRVSQAQASASNAAAAVNPWARDWRSNREPGRDRWPGSPPGWWARHHRFVEEEELDEAVQDYEGLWDDELEELIVEEEVFSVVGGGMPAELQAPALFGGFDPAALAPPPAQAIPAPPQPAAQAGQPAQPAAAGGAVQQVVAVGVAAPAGDATVLNEPAPRVELAKPLQMMASKLPGLQTLVLDGCDAMHSLRLAHTSLKTLVVARCIHLKALALSCPSLTQLNLKECSNLTSLGLKPMGLQHLSLGSVPSLVVLQVCAPHLDVLDLKGCANLIQVKLEGCSSLHTLDTQFCSALDGPGLADALSAQPPLQHLILSVNAHLGEAAISALSSLTTLQSLDLSYTDVRDLRVLAASMQHLTRLVMVSCSHLQPATLMQLLAPTAEASSSTSQQTCHLRSLDCSYCPLEPMHVWQLVNWGSSLECLQLNGVDGVDDTLWQAISGTAAAPETEDAKKSTGSCTTVASSYGTAASVWPLSSGASDVSMEDVEADQPTSLGASVGASLGASLGESVGVSVGTVTPLGPSIALQLSPGASETKAHSVCVPQPVVPLGPSFRLQNLQVLSLVRCRNLTSLCLGLLPAQPLEVWEPKQYNCYNHDAAAQVAQGLQWLTCSTSGQVLLPQLHTLRLGLGQLQVLALALPSLTNLDISSCKRLRALELRTPQLASLNAQGCACLPAVCLTTCISNLPVLSRLDVQFSPGLAGIMAPATHTA